MELLLIKTPQGFVPANEEEHDKARRFKVGSTVRADVSQIRNYKFLQKFFTMLKVGFDAWEPVEKHTPFFEHYNMPAQKNFERFRKDCLIAAGFYEPVINLKGEVRAEAKSISFANMAEDEFEKAYSGVADVLLQRVLKNYSRDDLDEVVQKIMDFV